MKSNPDSSHKSSDRNKPYKKDASRKPAGSGDKPYRKNKDDRPAPRKPADAGRKDSFADRPARTSGAASGAARRPERGGDTAGKRTFGKPAGRPAGDSRRDEKKPFAKPSKPYSERPAERKTERPVDKEKRFPDRKDSKEEGGAPMRAPRPYVRKQAPDRILAKDRPATGNEGAEGGEKPFRKPYARKEGPSRPFDKDKAAERRPAREGGDKPFRKPFERKEDGARPFSKDRFADRKNPKEDRARPFEKPQDRKEGGSRPFDKTRPPARKSREEGDKPFRKPYERKGAGERPDDRGEGPPAGKQRFDKRPFRKEPEEGETAERRIYPAVDEKAIDKAMTLNKYIAHSGESGRREAAEMVKQGKVRVNGELVLEPGYRVVPGDQVTLSGKKLTPQKDIVYVLLNKPKGFITTTEDPEERKTVMDLVANAGPERLFPVGRLDRNTTGVLLLTNDGALAHKLSHPSYNIKKVYQVTLDKNLTRIDYEKISKGVDLEDGKAQVDAIAYLENRNEVGLEIHSGKNRIVRRIFESLGYSVEKLDRVMYAGLTKKNLARGKWRFLTEREVVLLKHFKI